MMFFVSGGVNLRIFNKSASFILIYTPCFQLFSHIFSK